MSVVRYNDIVLPYARMRRFDQVTLYNEETDWYLTKFDIVCDTVINYNYLAQVAPALANQGSATGRNPAAIMKYIRTRLMQPRKLLTVTFNDYDLIPFEQNGNVGTCDAKNGPQPQSCTCTDLMNQTFLVSYHITAHYWENPNSSTALVTENRPGNPVLANRWTEYVDIDATNFTRYVREGKFMIRSDNVSGLIADKLRVTCCLLGVRKGFVRERSRYVLSPDGLTMQYSISDREVYRMPPSPAYQATGEYIEMSTTMDAQSYGIVRIRLVGDKETNQARLVEVAMQAAQSKLQRRLSEGANVTESLIPQESSLRVSLYTNEVEYMSRVRYSKGLQRISDVAGIGKYITFPPKGSEPGTATPFYPIQGTAGILLKSAAYYDPSLVNTRLTPEGKFSTGGLEPGQAGTRNSGTDD